MMDHTPIEALFHHSPNCPCESCRKIIKPYQNGSFVRKEDLDTMNKSIQELLQENTRIQTALDQANQQKVAMEQYIQQLLQTIQTTAVQAQSAQESQAVQNESKDEEEEEEEEPDSDGEESEEEEEPVKTVSKKAKNQRNITISLDTTKLLYIGIIVFIAIMVLKK
jgi:uncharacterized membrane protein